MSYPVETGSDRRARLTSTIAAIVVLLMLPLLLAASPNPVSIAEPISLGNHWARESIHRCLSLGLLSDGSFGSPDEEITRAEFLKLLFDAIKLPPVDPSYRYDRFSDVAGHWIQEYVTRAAAYGSRSVLPDGTELFKPDGMLTRSEAVSMAAEACGRLSSSVEVEDAFLRDLPFRDFLEVPEENRRFVIQAYRDGIVDGYPGGSFQGNRSLTWAEAATIVCRVIDFVDRGLDPSLKLVIDGEPKTDIALARRDDIIYAPVSAIYGRLEGTIVESSFTVLTVTPGNNAFFYDRLWIRVYSESPAAFTRSSDSEGSSPPRETAMLGESYFRMGELMLPVASVSEDGQLPFVSGHFDETSGTVYLATAQDWPGYRLPQSLREAELNLVCQRRVTSPGLSNGISSDIVNQDGNRIIYKGSLPPIVYSVDPSSPVRLRAVSVVVTGSGSLDLVYGPDSAEIAHTPDIGYVEYMLPVTGPGVLVPEDTPVAITATIEGMEPSVEYVRIEDRRPCRLSISAEISDGDASLCTVEVRYLDNRDRLVDFSHQQGLLGYDGPSVEVIGPNGTPIPAAPILVPRNKAGVPTPYRTPFVVIKGVSKFTFPYAGPGEYRITARSPLGNPPIWNWGDTLTELRGEEKVVLP